MMTWQSGDCDTNGVTIHYVRTGGTKPPVVLLHGLAGSGACWTPLARALEDAYDVVMPDARGHGASSAPLHGYRYADHARDVAGLIRELQLRAPVLIGHSMGGLVAAVVASEPGADVRGVVLADPTFLSPDGQREVYDSDVAEQHRLLLTRDKRDAVAEARARHRHRSAEILELLAEARLAMRMSAFEVLAPPIPDYRDAVRAIRAPILLVIGDAPVVSRDTARELQQFNPRMRFKQIARAGHGLPYDQPERFAFAVRFFLRSLRAGQ